MRTAFQLEFLTAALLLALGTVAVCQDQTEQAPPKELVQYIHDARQRGVAEARIKKQAVAVGWSQAQVDNAIAYEKSAKGKGAQSAPASLVATPSESQQASSPGQSMVPSAPSIPSFETPAGEKSDILRSAPATPGTSDDYLIGSGDTLQISVWKEQELSVPAVVVRPDGKITMPLIKEVAVAGLSPRQAEAVITEGLGKFISDPNVTVVVASTPSKKIYLVGAVKKEAPIPYTYGMTVLQALSEAGGLNDYAKRKKIYILRTEGGREYRLDFNYEEVVRGQNMGQNFLLLPGDTVVIPQ